MVEPQQIIVLPTRNENMAAGECLASRKAISPYGQYVYHNATIMLDVSKFVQLHVLKSFRFNWRSRAPTGKICGSKNGVYPCTCNSDISGRNFYASESVLEMRSELGKVWGVWAFRGSPMRTGVDPRAGGRQTRQG